MSTTRHATARVLCVDAADRVLLMRWRDPVGGKLIWEPPGGGVEAGESLLVAARRELVEETGLDPGGVIDRWAPVQRDMWWNGLHYTGTEHYCAARFDREQPPLGQDGLQPDELASLDATAWVPWDEVRALADPVEPPQLLAVLAALLPDGPWAVGGHAAGAGAPDEGEGAPDRGEGAPDRGEGAPDRGEGAPDRGEGAPDAGAGAAVD
ncbi:NUDIX domain-containing protein [Streptomyces sp. NPDC060194]|uniref:NUDIX domain-containing protein n=1 Tax=Streptomyces sp. NPDC060194 TaxID=3347069 RepID=UPI00365D7A03